jgi:acyl carrier protein
MQVKKMIVENLRLTISPDEIQDGMTLFGSESELGLDSVDALEIILELDRTYGIKIKDEETGQKVLRSVNTIVETIQEAHAQTQKAG